MSILMVLHSLDGRENNHKKGLLYFFYLHLFIGINKFCSCITTYQIGLVWNTL